MENQLTADPPGDPAHNLDSEVIYEGQGPNAAVEAMNIQGVLSANGITVLAGDTNPYPSLPVTVRVPRDQWAQARQILSDAETAGTEAAEAAELAGERQAQKEQ